MEPSQLVLQPGNIAPPRRNFLFSFIILTSDAKPYLSETIESVLAQIIGFKENIQIVLVNDGSTDGMKTVCKQYCDLYPDNIISIDTPNGGVSFARNAGLKAAAGRYINFFNAGDKWDTDACEAAINFFGQHPEINVACFPITLFGTSKGAHWLNYKFTKTRVANILKETDSAVLDLCSCFCVREAVKNRLFDEALPISDESAWIAKLLLDEQNFALITKPYCHCRSSQSSATGAVQAPPEGYADSLRTDLDILRHAKERYGETPAWAQHTVMLNLCRRLREEENRDILTPDQKEKYQELMRNCLEQIDDRLICTVRNPWPEERLLALALKHGRSYEQIKEWIKSNGEEKPLYFCRPGAAPLPFAKPWELRLESMDIVGGQLLLRGSCAVWVAPSERMRLVLTLSSPDGAVQEYPCKLLRRPDLQRKRLVFEENFWPREGFELALPPAATAEIRAFIEIDGLRFDLKWQHKQKSPFARSGERPYWECANYAVSPLPDNAGLRMEARKSQFLFSFIIPAYNVKPYLAEAVESVIAQTIGFEENIQIVLVNDGSTDGTSTVCKQYRDLWPENILYIDKPNGGVSSARNAGLKAATGHYIGFLDADDKWDPGACMAALDFFETHPEVHIVCFPIMFFGRREGEHWLNYKFKQTRVANIFKDTDYALYHVITCFVRNSIARNRPFNENLSISEDVLWLGQLLLDERNFGVIAKPSYRYRKRFNQSSAIDTKSGELSYYLITPRLCFLELFRLAREKYGEMPRWIQYFVMLDLTWRIKEPDDGFLTPAQKEEYQKLLQDCLKQIDDQIICTVRNLWAEERLLALALKHGRTYEQIKEWVEPNEEENSLHFCRPGAESLQFTKPWDLWLESMDIAEGQLLLRGSCAVLNAPSERMRLVLTVASPDGGVQPYPCELLRRPDLQRKRLVFEENFWPREGFELPLSPVGATEIRAFVEIDGRHFDLKWLHKAKSPFIRSEERLFWQRAGFVVWPLSDGDGLRVEAQDGDGGFLFSFVIPCYNVKPYLAEAVESVIAQTIGFEENIQIVLVNDGSTDGTGTVCKRYHNLYPDNIVYIDKPNGGVSSARNAGLKAATGHYINFLDADDKWDPGTCEAALDFFEKHPEIHIVCFPMMFFDRREGAHWLNYKFKQTRVANIFTDTDYAVPGVINCIIKNEIAKYAEPFDESLSIAEDGKWITKILLDEQDFGVISKPSYRYRKRFGQDSAIDTSSSNLSYYFGPPRRHHLEEFRYAKEKYGKIFAWLQYTIMLNITWRIKQKDDGFLTPDQKEEYRNLVRACLAQIDDGIILTVRNLRTEERLCALALKYGITYEQVKAWVNLDEENGILCFIRPGAQPLKLADIPPLCLEFMDIVDSCLLLRGSCFSLTPSERMAFALEMELPNGDRRKYPCELYQRVDRKKYPFFEDDEIWGMESFKISLPLAAGICVRAFVVIDGIRVDLKWRHEKLSPFVRGNRASYLVRGGYIVSELPDSMGLRCEAWTVQRAQKLERTFLAQIARQLANTYQTMQVNRIRQVARKMRRLSQKPIWLISDRVAFAGDNGEALFEYIMAHPEVRKGIRPIFLLSKDSPDWKRLKQIGPTVADGSVLHKVLFLAADKIISSSADENVINPFYKEDFLYRDLFNYDFVYLKHGVIKNDHSQRLCQANKNIALFVTAAQKEHDFIVEGDYGYPPNQVMLIGLPRHDKLLRKASIEKTQRLVAVMPTWRKNLSGTADPQTGLSPSNPNFKTSEYFQFWNNFINHPRLLDSLRAQGYRLRFALHPRLVQEADKFQVQQDIVEFVPHCDYQQTFCEAALLLSDYSSVLLDFALLRKPIIYAQFDIETFFKQHTCDRSYFDDKRDGFGPVCPDLETTVDAVIHYLENGCKMEPMYHERVDAFFGPQPESRCQLLVDAIKKLGRRPE